MSLFLDSFWRAVAYCLHPRVIALSFLPLAIMVALSLGVGYFYWDAAVEGVRAALESSDLTKSIWGWLQGAGAGNLKTVVAPLIVIFAVTPLIVLLSLLTVAGLMAPALASLVGERRFPQLERKHGGSLATSIAWSLGSAVLALVVLVVSLPLWLVPPLILVLPPLIWGWLTYRVMAPRSVPPPPAVVAGHRGAHRLPGCRTQRRLGFGRPVRGSIRHFGAARHLDLHAGVCLFLAVVRTLLPGRAGKAARRVGRRPRAASIPTAGTVRIGG
jgi:hypothetical protein